MKKFLLPMIIIIAIVVVAYIFLTPKQANHLSESKAPIAATIFPIYDIAQNISGDVLSVELILESGASPHTYEPTPSDLRKLDNTKVVYSVGHEFDDWVDVIIESADAQKITVDSNIDLLETKEDHEDEDEEEHDHDEDNHGCEHGEDDPHYWLTIPNAKIIAQNIAEDLSKRFPDHTAAFESNLAEYLNELDATDTQIRSMLDAVDNKGLITLHDAWYYFAEEYGFHIVGTFEPSAGREPTPHYIIELTEAIENSGSKTLYSEPQLSTSSIEAFMSDNDLKLAELDPLGGVSGRETYIDLMLYNAGTIQKNQ